MGAGPLASGTAEQQHGGGRPDPREVTGTAGPGARLTPLHLQQRVVCWPGMGQDGGMIMPENLLGGPPPILLSDEPAAREALDAGNDPTEVAAQHPTSSAAWAALADRAFAAGRPVESYAYARVGYHRGLDALRRAGWKGAGPVPWSHAPNRGFLRALHALGRAAAAIGEQDEAQRCATFLRDSDPEAARTLGD